MAFDARPSWGAHPAFLPLYVEDCDATYRARPGGRSGVRHQADGTRGAMHSPFRGRAYRRILSRGEPPGAALSDENIKSHLGEPRAHVCAGLDGGRQSHSPDVRDGNIWSRDEDPLDLEARVRCGRRSRALMHAHVDRMEVPVAVHGRAVRAPPYDVAREALIQASASSWSMPAWRSLPEAGAGAVPFCNGLSRAHAA